MQNVARVFRDTIFENNRHACLNAKHWPSVPGPRPFSRRHPTGHWHFSCWNSSSTAMNAWMAFAGRSQCSPRCESSWRYVHPSLSIGRSRGLAERLSGDRWEYSAFHWNRSDETTRITRVRGEDGSIDAHSQWSGFDGRQSRGTQSDGDIQGELARLGYSPDTFVFVPRVVANRFESSWNYCTVVLYRSDPWWDRELRHVPPYFLHRMCELPLLRKCCFLPCW